jgi:2-polyprenyl-6-hydroxyphenyl methylase/3-demethylubiquinone-9 3-methyltransferase
MNAPEQQAEWPDSWRLSHRFDELEVYGSRRDPGYTYRYETRRRHILDLISTVAIPGDRIIDIAAAQGNFSIALAKLGYAVTWNDYRSDLIDFVKLKYPGGGIDFRPGNVFEFAPEALFDVALVAEVIEHVAHPDEFLAHIARLVRPGGHIVLTTPNGKYFRNRLPRFSDCRDFSQFEAKQFGPDAEDHIFLLHPEEIHMLARACDLELVEMRTFGTPLTAGFLGTAPVLRIAPRASIENLERLSARLPPAARSRVHIGLAALLQKSAAATAEGS